MNYKTLEKIFGTVVFLITVIVLGKTVQPSVSFWDCGEVSAAANGLQVPHPPGSPFMTLLGRIFAMIPSAENLGLRINYLSVFTSGLSILFLFLIIVKLIENYRGKDYASTGDALITYISAAIGALAGAFAHSFWFNGTESEIYALNTTVFIAIMYVAMIWNERSDDYDNAKYILLIVYLIGISTTLRMYGIFAIIPVVMMVMFKKYVTDEEAKKKTAYMFLIHAGILAVIACFLWANEKGSQAPAVEEWKDYDTKFKIMVAGISVLFVAALWRKLLNRNSVYIAIFIGFLSQFVIRELVVKKIPEYLGKIIGDDKMLAILLFVLLLAALSVATYYFANRKKTMLHIIFASIFLIVVGYSNYTMVIIRANQNPPMNENQPDNFTGFLSYLNREQYGDFPSFKRRFSDQSHQLGIYQNYSSDLDFLWKYQMNHMMTRYIVWTYGGREAWYQDAGPNVYPFNKVANLIGGIFNLKFAGDGHNSFFGIPLLLGLLGIFFHFRKDWKMAMAFMFLFIFTTYLFAFYQNQQEPQPRERDKFYGAGMIVFAIWIGIAAQSLIDIVKQKIASPSVAKNAQIAVMALIIFFVPVRMLWANYHEHDRSRNWIPWDYAYNLLQSCAQDAILFTNGDNDTFPLWYLQDVEGVRRDVRIVNLSLGNTPWYINQLKNQDPYGNKKLNITIPDEQLNERDLRPVEWKPQMLSIDVPKNFASLTKNSFSKDFDAFDIKDSSVIKEGKITWKMDHTLTFGDVHGIRVQDILVKEIILNHKWERPVYFAVTCTEDCKIGLGDYLKMEGLALRLVPEKKKPGIEFLNETLLRKHLFEINKSYDKNYKPGFKYRGVDDPTVFLDENMERLIQNYRNSFIRLAIYYVNTGQKTKASEVLDLMEKQIPRSHIAMDFRLMYDVSSLFYEAGNKAQFDLYAKQIETEALKTIEANPTDVQSYYNPYRLLMELYEKQGEFDKAIAIMYKLKAYYPNDPSINATIEKYRQMKAAKDTIVRK